MTSRVFLFVFVKAALILFRFVCLTGPPSLSSSHTNTPNKTTTSLIPVLVRILMTNSGTLTGPSRQLGPHMSSQLFLELVLFKSKLCLGTRFFLNKILGSGPGPGFGLISNIIQNLVLILIQVTEPN